jgi:DNA-binding CsgD family transcriptional regulator
MTSVLYGRDAQARAVLALLEGARAGRSGALVVSGEAGIGKTALLGLAASAAESMTVLPATAIETEAELPFAGLHLLLRPVLGQLARIPRPQADALNRAFGLTEAPGQPDDDIFLCGLAVLSLLTEITETSTGDRPVLCLVDDAQWLDSASATALLFAARRLDAEAVAILLAVRDGARPISTDGIEQLHLEPLGDAAARQLLRDEAAGLEPQLAERVLADAAGNPLAITELARAAVAAPPRGQHGRPGPLPAGQRMQRLYGRKVSDLPDATRLLLLVAAAAGAGELALVLTAARSLGIGTDALTPAEEAGLVTVAEGAVAFRHPLVRTAVYHDAPLARRQAAHRALADALAGPVGAATTDWGGSAAGRRAWHLASAAAGHDDHAADELAAAAEQARHVSGYAAVAAAYERAAELTTDPAVRARRFLAAATAASDTGQSGRADRLLCAAEGLSRDPLLRAEATYLRARAYGAGHRASLAALADAARDIAVSHPDLAALMFRGLVVSASNNGQEQLAASARASLADLERVTGKVEEIATPHERLISGFEAWRRGDHETALARSASFAAECRQRGMAGWLAGALHCQGLAEAARGEWPAARATLLEGLRLAADIGQPVRAGHAAALLAVLAATAGDEPACRSWLAAFSKEDISGDAWDYGTALPALIELGRGRFTAALTGFRVLRADDKWRGDMAFWYQPYLTEAAARGGDPVWAAETAALFCAWAAAAGQPWALAVAARCRGLTEAQPEPHFAEALRWHAKGGGRPFESARTHLVYGEWLRREKRRSAAAAQLTSAVTIFDKLGATSWAERARAELAALGQAAARAKAPGVLARLTPQEYQIVTLAARGLSNREIAARLFLSHRTVSYHLYKAYPKLDVCARSQLAALIADQA